MVAEALYNTGQFQLIEEKEIVKRELIEDLVHTYWVKHRDPYSLLGLRHIAGQLGTRLLAYGQISYSRFSSRSIGWIFSHTVQKLRVVAEVCLYSTIAQRQLCREGEGEAVQTGTGVVYEFHGDRLEFERNAAGIATAKAIAQAVAQLLAKIHFVPN